MKNSTIKPKLTKKCKNCGKEFKLYKTTDKYCSVQCAKSDNAIKSINKVSAKQSKELYKYNKLRKAFLLLPENKYCFVDDCNELATTIEHTKGRGVNLLKISTWKPCCLKHNLEFERNPELSHKYQESKLHPGRKIIK